MRNTVLRWISYIFAALALAASAVLLSSDANFWQPPSSAAAPISSAPLLLVGSSFLLVQILLRPRLSDLMKNLLLAATFLLWGIVQLLPPNETARRLGDLVIVLYVLDLAWTIFTTKNSEQHSETRES